MDHFKHIYAHRAAAYHRLITPEDVDGNLLPALERAREPKLISLKKNSKFHRFQRVICCGRRSRPEPNWV